MKMQPQSSESKPLKINEIFYSVQGEGKYSGTAAIFVRLAGCSMACPWCDTTYAQKTTALMTPQEILAEIEKHPAKTIIITGGEPTEQNIQPLLKTLKDNNCQVHIETNGSIDTDTTLIDCVTVSPKKNVCENMLKKADVIKVVLDGIISEEEILNYKKYINNKTALYLQPEGNKKENLEQCLRIIKSNPQIRLSLQMHKLINIK